MTALLAEVTVSTTFFVFAIIALVFETIMLAGALFDRGPRYKITGFHADSLDSDEFLYMLEALTDAKVNTHTSLEVLTNGDQFYEAELEAIAAAKRTVNLEAYIFQSGEIAKRFVDALTERARAGVKVNLLIDGLGSASTRERYFAGLKDAKGKVAWYHDVRWNTLPRYNNRTHRELLIIDGEVGFVGGAGIADHWYKDHPTITSRLRGLLKRGKRELNARWRDTMVRVEGDAVPNLQATFAENWLEACGELLAGKEYFPICKAPQRSVVLVVNSTPSAGGSTRARILFQTLVASAQRSIHITTPYFLPDLSLCDELIRARKRGVEVEIVAPGTHSDHLLTRSTSRRVYGKLLEAGAKVFEYQAAMIHAKVLVVDGVWSVVGSTNFDSRSFGINDEVNLAAREPAFAQRLDEDFARDIGNSELITLERWKNRSVLERAPELLGWVLERQQ